MKQLFKVLFSVGIIILLTSNCARKGRPNGGLKDSLAPIMVTANPPYKNIHFKSKKITLSFDEYINLKDVNKQLVVSPPLKTFPEISPQGYPSREITIKLSDTLQKNTTYTFNFGNSIEDNNEGNILKSFKYVFSTGSYIDSLSVKGKITDAYSNSVAKNTSVLLFKVDSTFNDSIIYKRKPNYVSNTLDSSLFNLTNLAKGKYLLIALKDFSNNYQFNPQEDKIGFYNTFIDLPKDSVIKNSIPLFKEIPAFFIKNGVEVFKGKLQFGFIGDRKGIQIEVLSKTPSTFKSYFSFEKEKDTINYWHSIVENDSLIFKITKKNYIDTLTVFLRKKAIDSLKINSNINRTFHLKDTITFTGNNPITKIDTTKIVFIDKDSVNVPIQKVIQKNKNQVAILFNKKHNDDYRLTLLPHFFTDIFETKNDTLKYSFTTKEPEDYGSIALTINKKTNSPVIIELLTEGDKKLVQKKVAYSNSVVNFNLLTPGKYVVRGIIDANQNNKWDTGNYLQKLQPEKVVYLPIVFNIRANWHFPETFTID